jgi:peptidoglycan hydrolase-like protein with peptidoglycan-binding domain
MEQACLSVDKGYHMNQLKNIVYPAQMDTQSFGKLQVNVVQQGGIIPVNNATVQITSVTDPTTVIEELTTDAIGNTPEIELPAPPFEYSQEPTDVQPYAEYNIRTVAPGFESVMINGAEILPQVTALQPISMARAEVSPEDQLYVIPPHTLFGEYPPKIAEEEIKPTTGSGEIVLLEVVIPEFVVVHDGPPTDTSAKNHYVRYRDYIKNVASSEIYATWPESSILANILAIMSFTLNRVYTEWYRNQGYNFTITSSTAFDHKWMAGRNIYTNIGLAVDSVFNNFLSRPNVRQPILTQYCDGRQVQCPGWMTQWGSKALGDQGYEPIEIIRHFYGNNMYINSTREVAGVPSSWPGSNLTIGSRGVSVRQMQEQLNAIANVYSSIPKIAVDGVFGPQTEDAVRKFQQAFRIPVTGIVDLPTWYKISEAYVGVTRIGV